MISEKNGNNKLLLCDFSKDIVKRQGFDYHVHPHDDDKDLC